ncbi:helix-turn-helix domain-containing protein [Staphylospora marina]|uniref:helix-turn-helix domain-containing protein n=1 Tax=Staphylospora marina TaxID=2490858 RepID=UPI000F5BA1FB|nr:helix-turn-helix domain-containing protein [Staphylospora marina]
MTRSFDALRAARESMGMSLEEAAVRTGVDPEVLARIERGDFSGMSDSARVRGWIRAYARLVKVNPSPLLREFSMSENHSNTPSAVPDKPLVSRVEARRSRRVAKRSWKDELNKLLSAFPVKLRWVAAGVGVLILTGIGAWLLLSGEEEKPLHAETENPAPRTEEKPEVTESKTGMKRPVLMLTKTSESYKYGDLYTIRDADRVEVKIKALNTTKVRVRGGGPTGEPLVDKSLNSGDVVSAEHDEWISVRLDHPNRVELFVNGVFIDTSKLEEVSLFQLKLEGVGDGEEGNG